MVSETEVKCVVVRGGAQKARQGINVPDLEVDCAALTAKDIDAERALQIGLVAEVLKDKDELLARARQEARTIAGLPPLVVQGVKEVMNAQLAASLDRNLDFVATWNSAFLASEDLGEAIGAFFERRPPVYKGQ